MPSLDILCSNPLNFKKKKKKKKKKLRKDNIRKYFVAHQNF